MDGLMTGAHVIMEPARDALEQACRDRTWWCVYLYWDRDRWLSGWYTYWKDQ